MLNKTLSFKGEAYHDGKKIKRDLQFYFADNSEKLSLYFLENFWLLENQKISVVSKMKKKKKKPCSKV